MTTFMFRSQWGRADTYGAVLSLLIAGWLSTMWLFPASSWIVLTRVYVADTTVGVSPQIEADRLLFRSAHYGEYTVIVRNASTTQIECLGRRAVPYNATAGTAQIRGRDLNWWAYSEDRDCLDNWPTTVGAFYVSTQHCWRRFWWAIRTCNEPTISNIFTVREKTHADQ